jgi:hypothetical protein
MKMELIPKPALVLALILALAAISASDDFCLDPLGPKPDIWFDCWDCPYQCHGDADCQAHTRGYRVYTTDLEIIRAVAMGFGNWPARYPDDFNYNPCADFDRDFDVDDSDVAICENWYGSMVVPPDCPGRPLELEPIEPNALVAGSTYMIEWTDVPSSCSSRYKLTYSIDNGQNWVQIEPNEFSDTCSFDWIVPTVDSNQCLLRIHDLSEPGCSDPYCWIRPSDTTDDPFAIYECPQTLTGDLDENCYIDFRDLNVLGLNWPIEPSFQMLAALAEQWCGCGNPYDPACGY